MYNILTNRVRALKSTQDSSPLNAIITFFLWHGKLARVNLVPRPSSPPDFDRLQFAKMEGEGLVHFPSVYLGRQNGGGAPDRKNELEAFSCSFCPKH